jgi:Ca2+:H+ antiporter
MFAGGLRFKKQEFNRTGALASGSTLFIAAAALVMPAIFPIAVPQVSSGTVETFSLLVSLCMLVMYAMTLIFSLYTHKHLYAVEDEETAERLAERWPLWTSIGVLFAATLGVAWMSDILVGAINPIAAALGWTQLFIGVVIIAIVGNAAEHASAIAMACKNKMDLALQVSIGSATQVAMFVAPVLVFVSLGFANQMNLIFNTFELVSILLSVAIVNIVLVDGESNWLEGAQLLIAYLIIAIAFFVHP